MYNGSLAFSYTVNNSLLHLVICLSYLLVKKVEVNCKFKLIKLKNLSATNNFMYVFTKYDGHATLKNRLV